LPPVLPMPQFCRSRAVNISIHINFFYITCIVTYLFHWWYSLFEQSSQQVHLLMLVHSSALTMEAADYYEMLVPSAYYITP
jgi:hypothetical protein